MRTRAGSPRPNATPYLISDHRYNEKSVAHSPESSSFPLENRGCPAAGAGLCAESGGATEQPARRQRQLVGGSRHCFSPGDPAPATSDCAFRPEPALPQSLVLLPTLGWRLLRAVTESGSRVRCRDFPVAPLLSGDPVINLYDQKEKSGGGTSK